MEKKRLYFAASLFNFADLHFNAALSSELENYFNVSLPQREGFEFSKLHQVLEEIVDKGEEKKHDVENIVNHLIYYLDVGFLLPNCDFCLARLDEPMDPGVDIELMEAKEMRIPRIGFRTDVRTPYGSASNEVRGTHFFPAYNCDLFINFTSGNVANPEQGRAAIGKLAHLVYQGSQDIISRNNGLPHKYVDLNGGTQYIGHTLFQGIKDLHSEAGIKEVVRRYTELKKAFGNMNPGNMGIVLA